MRILFFGDIVGRSGRDALLRELPKLRAQTAADAVVVNAENSAHGFGINKKIVESLLAAGVDCITTGNHIWDQREILGQIDDMPRLLRPINYPAGTPGRGAVLLELSGGRKLLVVNAMARLFMDALDCPFAAMERVFAQYRLGQEVQGLFVDFHGEATSEKMAMGHFCDGQASLVVGTHSHVPTADAQILPGGTAYQTDAGMCGDYDSVIGMQKVPATQRFVRKTPQERLSPATGPATLCGVFAALDPVTGLARQITPVRVGGRLSTALPPAVTTADAA